MSLLKRNLAANYIGKFINIFCTLACIPIFISYLGIEAWALIGLYTSFLAIFSLLDFGLSIGINREFAKETITINASKSRGTLRSFEIIYWSLALFTFLIFLNTPDKIILSWLKSDQIKPESLSEVFKIIGVCISLYIPFNLYSSVLQGLQKQVELNYIVVLYTVMRTLGTIGYLHYFSNDISSFFYCQIASALIQTLVAMLFIWNFFGWRHFLREKFTLKNRKSLFKFSLSVGGTTIVGVLITQVDKFILSYIVPLDELGLYMLAWSLASGLSHLFTPLTQAIFPQLTILSTQNNSEEMKKLYHRACRVMAAVLLPVAFTIFHFAEDILILWTSNITISQNANSMLAWLIIGWTLNGLVTVPVTLILSTKKIRLLLLVNFIALTAYIPMSFFLTKYLGAIGTSMSFAFLFIVYTPLLTFLTHKTILIGEFWNWLMRDNLITSITVFLTVILLAHLLQNHVETKLATLGLLLVVWFSSFVVALIFDPDTRHFLRPN